MGLNSSLSLADQYRLWLIDTVQPDQVAHPQTRSPSLNSLVPFKGVDHDLQSINL